MSEYVEIGAKHLGFVPHSDQLDLGSLLGSGAETVVVSWPRRAGKTTGVWAHLIGLCAERAGSQVVVTAQSGVKARDRYMSMARLLERNWPESEGGPHIYRGAGHEALEFANGSRLWIVAPKAENFRGDAADVVYVDEPQELDPTQGANLAQAVLPLFDTVEAGVLVLSGTPGPSRAGWFWDSLELGRKGTTGVALSEFAAADHEDVHDPEVWARVHPGLRHGLTTAEKMQTRHDAMSEHAWRMEYMGQWPHDVGTYALDMDAWRASAVPMAERPERVGIAFDVRPDGSTATLAYAWRDETGKAVVEVVEHRAGAQWLVRTAGQAWDNYKQPLAFDAIGPSIDVAEQLSRRKPTPRLARGNIGDITAAAHRLAESVGTSALVHFAQPDLDEAVENATWREAGKAGRAFRAKDTTGAPIGPLVACSLALWNYDKGRDRKPIAIVG